MTSPHLVIIAGGAGERLGGVRKADLRVGGRRLIDRVMDAVSERQYPLMISIGPAGRHSVNVAGAVAVPDLPSPVGGPLAGLAAAVANLQERGIGTGLLVSVTVDTPFLPADFVAILRQGLGDAPATYAAWGDQFYPPNALWRIEALAGLPTQVAADRAPHSLKALHRLLGSHQVDWMKHARENPFVNLNTVADLLALGQTARNRELPPLIHTLGN